MTRRGRRLWQFAAVGLLLLLLVGVVAPNLSANQFGGRIQRALERALGRKVEIGEARFDLFTGPGFSLDNVVIHEDPSVGPEPFAYVGTLEAVPRLLPLLRGRLEIASIRLDEASINLVKSGPASDPGHWNFEPFLNGALMASFPEIHVRGGRINFKFGLTKSIFYLTDTDLDVAPPSRWSKRWRLQFSGAPARTDRKAGGFGRFAADGYWSQGHNGQQDRLDLELELAKGNIGEIIALVHGQHAGIHGAISSRMHLAGPWNNVRIAGRVYIEDIHRWDMLPPKGEGWPLNLEGRLDLTKQKLEMVSSSPQMAVLPVSVRFRLSDYLFQPHWGLGLNWNQFPTGAVLELARHMGVPVPAGLKMTGIVDGAIGYEGEGRVQGALSFHNTVLAMPDSPAVHFEQAAMVFADGHAHLSPAVARVPLPAAEITTPCARPDCDADQVQVEADFAFPSQAFWLAMSTGSMHVAALRSQVALAKVPWLEQVASGTWTGQLRYAFTPDAKCHSGVLGCPDAGEAQMRAGWSGRLQLSDAQFPLPGLATPLNVRSASAQIQGARVVLDRIQAEVAGVVVHGEYRYEPQTARPHRLRLIIPEADAADLEKILEPTLHRNRSLLERALGRALGRTSVPDWMQDRHVEGTVQIQSLTAAGIEVANLRARLAWDVAKVEFTNLMADVNGARLSGKLAVSLRGARPTYELAMRLKGLEWKSGTVDGDLALDTRGLGPELLANLRAKGTFAARGLDLPALPTFRAVSGAYAVGWAGAGWKLAFPELQLATAAGIYTGKGNTQGDGRLVIVLSNGSKEMRMSGTLAQLRMEEPVSSQ